MNLELNFRGSKNRVELGPLVGVLATPLRRMSLIYWERELDQPNVPFDAHFQLEVTLNRMDRKLSVLQSKVVDMAGVAVGGRVSAHKLVLALSSPVFKVL